MKHFPFRLSKVVGCAMAAVYGLSSCTSDEPVLISGTPAEEIKVESVSRFRSVSEAYEIAMRATSMLDDCGEVRARGGALRMLDVKNPVKVIRNPLSRSSAAINDTLMYVVNYADSMGFAVVSAVKGTPELIAVTMSGSYDPANPGDNPGFNMYMDNAAAVLGDKVWVFDSTLLDPNGHVKPAINEKTVRDTVWIKRVSPKARVMWGQHYPEGERCPNGVSGCSNTALAMAMLGLRYPSQIKLTYWGDSVLPLDWDALAQHKSWDGERDYCVCTVATRLRLAQLCRQLGYMSGTIYNDYGSIFRNTSSTTTDGTIGAIKKLGFNHYYDDVVYGSLSKNMNVESMVLVCGSRVSGGISVGHMWLCDGVKHYKIRSRYYRSYDEGRTWKLEATDYLAEHSYNMFNWGWDGGYNGYFLDMYFNANGNDRNYNQNVRFISIWR